MTDVQIEAGTLEANLTERTVSGLLLPFGEVGNTNLGKFSIDGPGLVKVPRDPSVVAANPDHDHETPVGRATSLTETAAGIVGIFSIADTDEGDQVLLDIESGARTKLSAEVKNIVLRAGKLVSGQLFGASFVAKGAFPSATLLAADVGEVDPPASEPAETSEKLIDEFTDESGKKFKRTITRTTRVEPDADGGTKTTITEKTVLEEPDTPAPIEEEAPVGAAAVPNTLQAASAATGDTPVTKREAISIFQALRDGNATDTMLARLEPTLTKGGQTGLFALNDVKYTGSGSVQPDERRSQWLDELWGGRTYAQQVIPLFNHENLTAKVVSGYRWTTDPAGGTWAGNKANIPTNTPVTEAATATAAFWAMGHDHAIEHEIFDTPGYFESYFAAGTDSYAAWADAKALTDALAGSTALEADNPAGLTIGAGFSALIDGAAAVILANALPTFALIDPVLWKAMMKTPADAVLGYLSAALKIDEGDLDGFIIRPHASITAGHVLVGAKEAMTVYELPSLIRVTAPDTVKGGIDTNMIGAEATLVHKSAALVDVGPYTA